MGYRKNPDLVAQRKQADPALLANLEKGLPDKWKTAKDPVPTERLAFKIRECLYIAARYPKRFPALAKASENFAIHIVEDGLVEARWKTGRTETGVQIWSSTQEGEVQGKIVSVTKHTTAEELKNAWMEHLPSSDPLHFTQTLLSYDELVDLFTWATHRTPRLMLLVDESNEKITVSLRDPSVQEFAWSPTTEPEEEEELDV